MLSLFEVQYFHQKQICLDIYLHWDYIYLASSGICNIRNVSKIRYFCQEQSWSRLECSILQTGTNKILKDTRTSIICKSLSKQVWSKWELHIKNPPSNGKFPVCFKLSIHFVQRPLFYFLEGIQWSKFFFFFSEWFVYPNAEQIAILGI